MHKWTINGALIFAFQGLVFAVARTYAVTDALLIMLALAGLGALTGAWLWRFLDQPVQSLPSAGPSQELTKNLSNV
ncbi:MAG: hypothetical protein R2911_27250 [Caldilineaceae bacterium]